MSSELKIKKIVSGALSAYINSIVGMLGLIAQSALAVRFLSTTDAGIWMLLLSLIAFLNLSDFGFSSTLSRLISFSLHLPRKELRIGLFYRATVRFNFWLSLSITCLMAIVVLAILFVKHKLEFQKIIFVLIVFIIAIFFRLLSNPNLSLLFGLKQISLSYRIRTTGHIINLTLLISLCLIKPQLLNFPLAILGQYLLLFFWSRLAVNRIYSYMVKKFSSAHFKKLFSQSVRIFLMGIGSYVIYEINTPILSMFVGLQQITTLAICLQVVTLLGTMSLITQSTTLPYLSSLYAQNKFSILRPFIFSCMKFNIFIAYTAAIFLYFHASQFFHLWLGEKYTLNQPLFLVLLITLVFQVQDGTLSTIAIACGYLKYILITFISGGLNIIFLFILAPHIGIMGAGISILAAQFLTNNWYSIFVLVKRLNVNIAFGELVQRYFLRLLICLIFFACATYYLSKIDFLMQLTWVSFVISILITFCVSVLLAILIFVTKDERKYVASMLLNKLKPSAGG